MEYPWVTRLYLLGNPARRRGMIVSRQLKMFKWTVAVLILLVLGYLAISNVIMKSPVEVASLPKGPLTWDAPTQHVDDTPLTDLAGYEIYCWSGEEGDVQSILISDPESTRLELESLPPGTYQCAIKAVSDQGVESALSNVVMRDIQ